MRGLDHGGRGRIKVGCLTRTRRRRLWTGPQPLPENARPRFGARSQILSRQLLRLKWYLVVCVEQCHSKFGLGSSESEVVDTWGRSPFHSRTSWYDTCRSKCAHILSDTELECQTPERESWRRDGKRNTRRSSWSTEAQDGVIEICSITPTPLIF